MIEGTNFPKRYAAMSLEEVNGYIVGTNQIISKYDTFAYIVSECYLVSETKKYFADGSSNACYEVVFPLTKKLNEKLIPDFNYDGQCYNSIFVDRVFEDIEIAKRIYKTKKL